MLDTDYPYFPPSQTPTAPPAPLAPLENLTGLTHCFLAFSAKKRARQTLILLVSRLKTLRRTRVRAHRDLSRGEPRGGGFRLNGEVGPTDFATKETPKMEHALKDLDRLLRGDATRLAALKQGKIEVEEGQLPWIVLALGLFYGLCMGCFALFNKPFADAWAQSLTSMAKVPVLFGATLLVTFPSLYVFNTLVGSRLTLQSVWRLLLSSMAVMLAVLASLGPIVAFFSISTTNYPFILLLNVVVFSLAGFLGLKFLLHTLHRLTVVLYDQTPIKSAPPVALKTDPLGPPGPALPPPIAPTPGAIEKLDERAMGASVRQVFGAWVLVFGMVGAQMSWVLRPFISSPDHGFVLFSPRESNFFAAVTEALFRVVFGQ